MVKVPKYNSPKWNAAWENFLLAIALEKKLTATQTNVFLTRFKQCNWDKKINDIWEQSGVNSYEVFPKHQSQIFNAFKPECPDLIGHGSGNAPILRKHLLKEFSGEPTIEYPRKKYIVRDLPPYLTQLGALIRIKAPSKMGKTLLLNSMLDFANQQDYSTVKISFLQIDSSKFDNLNLFLRWFCTSINDALELKIDLDRYWRKDRGSKESCTMFLEYILYSLEEPLVIGLDDVDLLLNYPQISQDFFSLLRSWHEKANDDEAWEKLRQIVVYSTDDFGSLNINQSPFNVGKSIEIEPFDCQQTVQLATLYQLDLSALEIEKVAKLLGGHPHLINQLMFHLVTNPSASLDTLLEQAPTDIGIYRSFLQQHLINLRENPGLATVFKTVVSSSNAVKIDTILARQLHRMGLIIWSQSGNTVVPSCELYQLYFTERLS